MSLSRSRLAGIVNLPVARPKQWRACLPADQLVVPIVTDDMARSPRCEGNWFALRRDDVGPMQVQVHATPQLRSFGLGASLHDSGLG